MKNKSSLILSKLTQLICILVVLNTCLVTKSLAQNEYEQLQKLTKQTRQPENGFGIEVSISETTAIVGVACECHGSGGQDPSFAGSAYIYELIGGEWEQVQELLASDRDNGDRFGQSVSISGNFAIVGARNEGEDENGGNSLFDAGSAYIFERIDGVWVEVQKIVASDRSSNDSFGSSVSINNSQAIIGAIGSAYIFEYSGDSWNEVAVLEGSSFSKFGNSVSIYDDRAIVGAPNEEEDLNGENLLSFAGAVYLYERLDGIWTEVKKVTPLDRMSHARFGESVSISGEYAVIGAFTTDLTNENSEVLDLAGAAHIFQKTNGEWTEVNRLTASDKDENDRFGVSVAIDEDLILVGAYNDGNSSSSLNGTGSVYVFKKVNDNWIEQTKLVASDADSGDQFGHSVAIDNGLVIVGAHEEDEEDESAVNYIPNAGAAYIFGTKVPLNTEPENHLISELKVFGNTRMLYIKNHSKSSASLRIVELSGRTVYDKTIHFKAGEATIRHSLKQNTPYILQIDEESLKFIISGD